ncbi:MAG TPA: hypothetical protein VKA68_11525 [bacterium]|nr:hypothetical protein [bacterium]
MVFNKHSLIPVFFAVLVLACCINNPASLPEYRNGINGENTDALARAFFTGRDSFGVAFNAKVSDAEVTTSENGFNIDGTGHATHFGRIAVWQNFRIIPQETGRDSFVGDFEFTKQGRLRRDIPPPSIAGTYRGTLSPDYASLEGIVEIDEHDIQATKADIDTVWAAMTGTIDFDRGSLSYRLDGWLLHFVKDNDED